MTRHYTRRLAVQSDLHVESPSHGPSLALEPQPADVLVVAGDISPPCGRLLKQRRHGALAWLRKAAGPDLPIVFVLGNAEYGHFVYDDVVEALAREAREQDIHFLHNDSCVIAGIEFLGTPLFTSQRLPGLDDAALRQSITRKIRTFNPERLKHDFCICGERPLCAAKAWQTGTRGRDGQILDSDWFAQEHDKAVAFLGRALSESSTRPRVVVSHWAPSLRCIPQTERPLEPKHAYWACDQDGLVAQSHLWIHGHVHEGACFRVGNDPARGAVLSNALGTPVAIHQNGQYQAQGVVDLAWTQDDVASPRELSVRWMGRAID